jgi:hypothetical protein
VPKEKRMITIPVETRGKEWTPSLDTLVERVKRILRANPDMSDQGICNSLYNGGLEVVPVQAIALIRAALKQGDHPICGFSYDNEWMEWANQHGIEVVRK